MKYNFLKILFEIIVILAAASSFLSAQREGSISLKEECAKALLILADDIISLQNTDSAGSDYGALFCKACSDHHTRASESVLPLAVAYRETKNEKYLRAALSTGSWLIEQQQPDGSWFETPDTWTGTTTDQLLSMSAAYPIIMGKLSKDESQRWILSIKKAADWLVGNMNPDFASINYCATSTAALMVVYQLMPEASYSNKAKELSRLILPKFDEDYFLTGEGNRVRGTKYGIDPGYNMDMSLWGLALYAKLAEDKIVDEYVQQSLKRHIYFIYPDGSTDGSWGVRGSKWTTYGSFTADGCQVLFGLYSQDNPVYRNAAIANLNYLMGMRENGLITYGPHYYLMFDKTPCIYPTFCRAKNLALAILYGDQTKGRIEDLPAQKTGWIKYFKTVDVALIRTKNIMATVSGYRYKDIRRGADFKYMFRPSGGSVTNLWVKDFGYLQASSQTVYHKWEMNYPDIDTSLSLTPRIEFADSNAYYTNLYEFDSGIELSENDGVFSVEASGELKDRNRWEGGVAYTLTHTIADDYVEKNIRLRFHGQKPVVRIVEPFIQNEDVLITKIDEHTVEITSKSGTFIFEILTRQFTLEQGEDAELYRQPFPSLRGYPIVIKVVPGKNTFTEEIKYRIKIKKV